MSDQSKPLTVQDALDVLLKQPKDAVLMTTYREPSSGYRPILNIKTLVVFEGKTERERLVVFFPAAEAVIEPANR